jgi:uncharacterized protein (TIGR02246 family)
MKKKAIVTLMVFAAASVAIATYSSKMLPKIAFAESTQAKEQPSDERAIREMNAAVEAAWNKHDAATLDQRFVEDCDFVNVFGEWISTRDKLVKIHTALFAGPFRESYKRFTVEKIRFVRQDVAIAHVRGSNTDRDGKLLEGDEGTIALLVMVKEGGKWWTVAGQNTQVRPLPEAFKPIGKPPAP